jgi:hypothetical protein
MNSRLPPSKFFYFSLDRFKMHKKRKHLLNFVGFSLFFFKKWQIKLGNEKFCATALAVLNGLD